MHAARAQPGEMPLADQQPGRPGLLLLRERTSQRIALLPGARAYRISVGRSAAQPGGCVSLSPPPCRRCHNAWPGASYRLTSSKKTVRRRFGPASGAVSILITTALLARDRAAVVALDRPGHRAAFLTDGNAEILRAWVEGDVYVWRLNSMRGYPPTWRLRMLAGVELPGGIRDLSAPSPLPLPPPLHHRCVWDLIGRAAGAVGRALALGRDAFEPEIAGMAEQQSTRRLSRAPRPPRWPRKRA
jgi:hypothetical protein